MTDPNQTDPRDPSANGSGPEQRRLQREKELMGIKRTQLLLSICAVGGITALGNVQGLEKGTNAGK
jgi:hypothetical protein